MSNDASNNTFSNSRRRLLQGAAAGAASLGIGFPSLARAADTIKVGVLQPLSGGLESLGQQGVEGTQLAWKRQTKPAACSDAARAGHRRRQDDRRPRWSERVS
jgi:hypothetical protein